MQSEVRAVVLNLDGGHGKNLGGPWWAVANYTFLKNVRNLIKKNNLHHCPGKENFFLIKLTIKFCYIILFQMCVYLCMYACVRNYNCLRSVGVIENAENKRV